MENRNWDETSVYVGEGRRLDDKKEAVFDELEVSCRKEDMLQYLSDRAELAMEGLTVIPGEEFAVQVMDGSAPLAVFRLQAYLEGEPVPCDWRGVLEHLDRE